MLYSILNLKLGLLKLSSAKVQILKLTAIVLFTITAIIKARDGWISSRKSSASTLFCGLCADICVYFTIKDAIAEKFTCHLIEETTYPWDKEAFKETKTELLNNQVNIIHHEEIGDD